MFSGFRRLGTNLAQHSCSWLTCAFLLYNWSIHWYTLKYPMHIYSARPNKLGHITLQGRYSLFLSPKPNCIFCETTTQKPPLQISSQWSTSYHPVSVSSWPKVVTFAPNRLVLSHLGLLSWPYKIFDSFVQEQFFSSEVFTILCMALIFSKNSHLNMKVIISFLPSTSSLLHGYLFVSQILLNPPGWVGRSECSQFHCFSPLTLLWL